MQRITALVVALAFGAALAGDAFAGRAGRPGEFGGGRHWGGHAPVAPHGGHRSRGHAGAAIGLGLLIGLPLIAPLYFDPPRYAYPDPYPVWVPSQPVMIQRAPVEPAPPVRWWYYCASAATYYPYVGACPEGWQKVPPQPPS